MSHIKTNLDYIKTRAIGFKESTIRSITTLVLRCIESIAASTSVSAGTLLPHCGYWASCVVALVLRTGTVERCASLRSDPLRSAAQVPHYLLTSFVRRLLSGRASSYAPWLVIVISKFLERRSKAKRRAPAYLRPLR